MRKDSEFGNENLDVALRMLLRWCLSRDFNGIDPYDALNSPFANVLTFGSRFGRMALTQLLRRSPVNLRPLLRIQPGANPKALGLFLEGVTKLARSGDDSFDYRAIAESLTSRLLRLRSDGLSGSSWGYNFPWQNRLSYKPPYMPTIVNTSFIGHALLDAYEEFGFQEALEAALSTPDFILNDIPRLRVSDGEHCFSYSPCEETYVHNANLLGASLLARIGASYGRKDVLDPALSAARYSLNRCREDGSWFYAERREQRWIDSFHTGFNLESIRRMLNLGLIAEGRSTYDKAVDFYARHFFLSDGTPLYYADRLYLVDVHAPAEGICFFAEEPNRETLVRSIFNWFMANLWNSKNGTFYFRKTKYYAIKTVYMRWSLAWAFRALATLMAARKNA